jgi:hypothetical protein
MFDSSYESMANSKTFQIKPVKTVTFKEKANFSEAEYLQAKEYLEDPEM